MEHDSALVQPVVNQLDFTRRWIRPGARRIRIGNEPKPLAFREFFREIGKNIGEDLAFAALRTANAGQPDPLLLSFRRGHCAGSGTAPSAKQVPGRANSANVASKT